MRCLYAFLLIPRQGLESTKRLAIISTGLFDSYYDVFKLEANQNFPVVESSTRIKTTKIYTIGSGTYPRAYCTNDLSWNNPIKHVTNGRKSASDNTHTGLGGVDEAAEKCLNVLKNLWDEAKESSQQYVSPAGYTQLSSSASSHHTPRIAGKSEMESHGCIRMSSHCQNKPPKILLSKIRGVNGCTDSGIISLAYQKKIKATGLYRYFAPEHSKAEYEVDFDEEVDIFNIVFPGQIFAQFIHEQKYFTIAWYMGHLHVFKKDNASAKFWPDTIMGSENINGDKIVRLIGGYYKVLGSVIRTVNELSDHEISREICHGNCLSRTKEFQQEKNRLSAEINSLILARLPLINETVE
ncbi:putative effector protein [Blumeria hordei DH14]|uniref:Putative effector protein n=1 Tax=Blumeria graminis f. sp. hordei (strain DH14) TaxID=546991 RepID=N1J7W1_BLUG1|nr:putative effector protein [Blumeria hordei DH14]